ncbi:MAG: hypothetical protein CL610_22330 [Anaerolineaceae bacterium]|nr:hypothetical protein [Anaerolineaceae bacterium]
MNQPVISATALRNLTECQRRVWLDYHGDAQLRSPLAADVRRRLARGILHEDVIQETMIGPVDVLPTLSWADALRTTRDLMAQGVPAIRGAVFEQTLDLPQPVVVRGQVDWLLRVSQPSDLGRWAYEPVEVKLYQDIAEADRLQLDLYLWLVAQTQGAETVGWFWLGQDANGAPRHQIEHVLRPEPLFAALQWLAGALDEQNPPDVFLTSHCDHCHWLAACTDQARQSHNFTLLPTLKRQTRQHLWEAGIRTFEEIAAMSPSELQRFYGIGKVNVHDIISLAQAFASDSPVWRADFPETLSQPGIMLDLETDLTNGSPWCFGWQVAGEPVQIVVVARYAESGGIKLPGDLGVTLVEDSDVGWEMLADAAQRVPGQIYHWTDFDRAALRKTAPRRIVDHLDDRMHDLHRTFKTTVTLPIQSTSIKVVGAHLGYNWPEGSNAFAAWDDYNRWLLDGDAYALARACAYQNADVEALDVVWRWLQTRT